MIRPASVSDAAAIAQIYNHYIVNTPVSFETQALAVDEVAIRIAELSAASLPWIVIEVEGELVGYAYASVWKGRCAYRFSVETTIYLDSAAHGRGFGSQLYEALLALLRERSVHAAVAGIALPNEASVALHEKFGFCKVAHFKEIGFKFDRWIDVGYWQLLI